MHGPPTPTVYRKWKVLGSVPGPGPVLFRVNTNIISSPSYTSTLSREETTTLVWEESKELVRSTKTNIP